MQRIVQYFFMGFMSISFILMLYCLSFGDCFSLATIKQYTESFDQLVTTHYTGAVLLYSLIFCVLVIAAFPIVAPITMLGGYSFGIMLGALYSCIAATVGSIITFALFRYILADTVQKKYQSRLMTFNQRIKEEGYSYLLMLHFLLAPFFIINVLAAVTPVSWWTFLWTTVIGSVPIMLVYAFAGQQLRNLESTHSILSWPVILMLIVLIFLACLPIIVRRLYRWYKYKMHKDEPFKHDQ